jgi:uncharacterized protein (TIGR02246 family)
MKNLAFLAIAALLAIMNTTMAAELSRPAPSDDATAVQAVGAAFVDNWNRHDMNSLGGLFTADAQFVNVIGLWWHGRAEIQKEHEALHATRMRRSHLVATDSIVHLLGPDVAVLIQRWQLTGDTGIDGVTLPMRRGIMTLVTVREGASWQIASAQNTDIVPLPNLPAGASTSAAMPR